MRISGIGGLAMAALGVGFAVDPRSNMPGRRVWAVPYGRYHSRTGSIATLNRHTGKPHEHKREIARRQRQMSR